MTDVGQAANAELATAAAAPAPTWIPRTLGFAAVALALLSALVTFLVLAGLTPIPPTHEVVVTLLLTNAVTVFLSLWSLRARSGGLCRRGVAGAQRRAFTFASLLCSRLSLLFRQFW
jgi:hypothetical protein